MRLSMKRLLMMMTVKVVKLPRPQKRLPMITVEWELDGGGMENLVMIVNSNLSP